MTKNRTFISRTGLLIFGAILALLAAEMILRAGDIDLRLMRKAFYYQCSYLPLHRTSADPQRLYELIPGVTVPDLPAATHPQEQKYQGKIGVRVNALGFRGRDFPAAKKRGVFRIVIFGGSNTFGSSVSEEDTYPAQLQKIFDEQCPGKVEVWNAGTVAYVMSQNVAYAETVSRKYDPDLLILQDTNRGRRSFRYDTKFEEFKRLFRENPELYIENIPPLWNQDIPPGKRLRYFIVSTASRIHHRLVMISAFYRSLCISLYTSMNVFTYNIPIAPVTERYRDFWSYNGQIISNREFNLFTENHKNKKVLLFFLNEFARRVGLDGFWIRENVSEFVLSGKDRPPEYRDVHPPSYVYTWYAEELYNFLVEKGYVPG